jgi:hypothetical protein
VICQAVEQGEPLHGAPAVGLDLGVGTAFRRGKVQDQRRRQRIVVAALATEEKLERGLVRIDLRLVGDDVENGPWLAAREVCRDGRAQGRNRAVDLHAAAFARTLASEGSLDRGQQFLDRDGGLHGRARSLPTPPAQFSIVSRG